MSTEVTIGGLNFGTEIHDGEGRQPGHIRGFDEQGFYVTFAEGLDGPSGEHVAPGGAFGEAELMWRYRECGAMGELDDELPDAYPECGGVPKDPYYLVGD